MAYKFWEGFGATKGYDAETLIHNAIAENWSYNRYEREAMRVNLSYNRANMQYDFRRAQAIEKAQSGEAKDRALQYFDEIYEPLRARKGWNSAQTTAFLAKGEHGELETLEEQEEFEDEWEKYVEMRKNMGL